jgi:hypothetical protein
MSIRFPRLVVPLVSLGTIACAADSRAARAPSRDTVALAISAPAPSASTASAPAAAPVAQVVDTAPRHASPKPRLLTEAEQQVADGVVFAPSITERFLVAARNKRLLVDVGRVDLDVKKDTKLLPIVRRVTARVGPLSHVTHVRVRGTWGSETDSITGYDVWNGRVVAVLAVGPATDSLLKRNAPLVGVATRVSPADSASPASVAASPAPAPAASAPATAPPPAAACVRDSAVTPYAARVAAVRDSLVRWVSDSLRPSYAATARLAVRGDTASGCFGPWRAIVVVTTRTSAFDWSDERSLLVLPDGKPVSARLRDLRLRTHESLVAFDADGDGIDELATRGLAPRMGAQSVLKLDPATRRFSRFASGFAWETR